MVGAVLPLLSAEIKYDEGSRHIVNTLGSSRSFEVTGEKGRLSLTLELDIPESQAQKLYEILNKARGGFLNLSLPGDEVEIAVSKNEEISKKDNVSDSYPDKW